MTAQETERVDLRPARVTSTKSAGKAYERRVRREVAVNGRVSGRNLTRTGSPIAAALSRVPFVAVIILMLAGGIVGVLLLNTMSDTVGLQASNSRLNQMSLTLAIQQDTRDIAAEKNPARLAARAKALGLVPPGDAAMLEVGPDGQGTVIGTPTPVAVPTPVNLVPPAAARTTPAQTTAPQTTAPQTTALKTGAPKTTAAPKATAPKATAPKTTGPQANAPKTTAAKTTAPTSTGAGQ